MDPERFARLRREIYDAPLEPAEFERRLQQALGDRDDCAAQAELCAWFQRRYPSAKERLDYCRRKYAEWMRSAPPWARER